MGTVYLIHFDRPLGDQSNPRGQARHYLGYSDNLKGRLWHHRNGTGAAIMRACKEAGIKWEVVQTWEGDRELERKLKDRHGSPGLCPVCREAKQQAVRQAKETEKERGQ